MSEYDAVMFDGDGESVAVPAGIAEPQHVPPSEGRQDKPMFTKTSASTPLSAYFAPRGVMVVDLDPQPNAF